MQYDYYWCNIMQYSIITYRHYIDNTIYLSFSVIQFYWFNNHIPLYHTKWCNNTIPYYSIPYYSVYYYYNHIPHHNNHSLWCFPSPPLCLNVTSARNADLRGPADRLWQVHRLAWALRKIPPQSWRMSLGPRKPPDVFFFLILIYGSY